MSEICTLIESTNPLLRIKLSECSSDLDREKVESQLIDSMKHYQGIGLSANQVGIMERVFVMYSDVKKGEIISCFNSYHGSTHGALSISGDEKLKQNFRPLLPNINKIKLHKYITIR